MHMHVMQYTHANTLEQCYIFECMCSCNAHACNYKFSVFFHPSPHAPRVASLRPSRALEAPVQGKEEEDVDIVRKTK